MNRAQLLKTGLDGLMALEVHTEDGVAFHSLDMDTFKAAITSAIDFEETIDSFDKMQIRFLSVNQLAKVHYMDMLANGHTEAEAQEVKVAILNGDFE